MPDRPQLEEFGLRLVRAVSRKGPAIRMLLSIIQHASNDEELTETRVTYIYPTSSDVANGITHITCNVTRSLRMQAERTREARIHSVWGCVRMHNCGRTVEVSEWRMKKRFIVSVVALLLYMGMIFWVSSLPNERLTPEQDLLGIIVPQSIKHVVEYAILGILMSRVMAQVSSKNLSIVLYSSTFSACYGILDEIHQHFVPTRCCTLLDMCINTIGSITGVLFYVAVARCCVHDYRETQS